MTDWLKKQVNVQNILMVVVLIATMFRNSTAWVMDLTTSSGRTASAVESLVEQTKRLEGRVQVLEDARLAQEATLAQTFPRRSELEPRLKAIEDNGRENNMMMRRFIENYRR